MKKILVAEDCGITLQLLTTQLTNWGYEVISTNTGVEAWERLQKQDAPQLAILDWVMPEMSGVEVCQKVRLLKPAPYSYLILLTANTTNEDITTGFAAGADDYIFKPFDGRVLQARVRAGERILDLEQSLAGKIQELESALQQVNQLQQLLPICMFCKKIRDDNDYWHQIEAYLHNHAGTDFSHGICPDCYANRHNLFNSAQHL